MKKKRIVFNIFVFFILEKCLKHWVTVVYYILLSTVDKIITNCTDLRSAVRLLADRLNILASLNIESHLTLKTNYRDI